MFSNFIDRKRGSLAALLITMCLGSGCVHHVNREFTITPTAQSDSERESATRKPFEVLAFEVASDVLAIHGFEEETQSYLQRFPDEARDATRRRIGFFSKSAGFFSAPYPIYCDVFVVDSTDQVVVVVREKNGSGEEVLASVVEDLQAAMLRSFPAHNLTVREWTQPGSILDP